MAIADDCTRAPKTSPHRFLPLSGASPLQLESGATLQRVGLAYESWGELDSGGLNGVLLLHGFTGNSHAASSVEAGSHEPGWWEGLIGPGRALDTNRYFVVCPNVLGGCDGSTGPSSLDVDGRPYGSRFPALTVRDLVAAEQRWADALGISRWCAVIGTSLGGMRGLEWAITAPERLERLVLIATTAACSPENRAIHNTQLCAIELDQAFAGGDYYANRSFPLQGLALARSIAQLHYGCEQNWGAALSSSLSCQSEEPLDEDVLSFASRFDANSYRVLTKAMNTHDIGRERKGIESALRRIHVPTTVISIQTDRLFPPSDQELIASHISNSSFASFDSVKGHDGFLYELSTLDPLLRKALNAECGNS